MTREEAIAIIENEKKCVNRANKNDYCNRDCYNCELVKTDIEILTALDMAIKALEYDDAKYHEEHGEVIVDKAVWEDAERALKQEPSGDAVSRQAVLDMMQMRMGAKELYLAVHGMPSVNPQEKTGHWIAQNIHNCHTDFKCSECGYIHNFMHLYGEPTADYTYCPNCGTRMIKSKEGSDKE